MLIKVEATRAGVTKETLGHFNGMARHHHTTGDATREIECLRKVLEINEFWGSRDPAFCVSTDTIANVNQRLDAALDR